MERLTIGEVAKRAHVRIETLRYYERTGLVASPPRSESNYRLYPQEIVRRVQTHPARSSSRSKHADCPIHVWVMTGVCCLHPRGS